MMKRMMNYGTQAKGIKILIYNLYISICGERKEGVKLVKFYF